MNWYNKILIASRNIRFSEETENDINEITNFIVDYRIKNEQTKEVVGPLTMENPYTKEELKINIGILPTNSLKPGVGAEYDHNTSILWVYVYHIKSKDENRDTLFPLYRTFISHELVHAIDPHFSQGIYIKPDKKDNNFLTDIEFNGYAKQIVEIVNRKLLDANKINEIKDWLRTQSIDDLPEDLFSFGGLLSLWKREKPDYIKRLFSRLYNDCIRSKQYVGDEYY